MKIKKSQGMPLNVIIIAAIVLAVLIVVLFIFTERAGFFSKNIKSCEQNGGNCVNREECESMPIDFECLEKNKVCCI